MGALSGDDVTRMDEDISRSGIVIEFVEEVLQVVETAVDVSDEEESGRLVYGWDVEGDGLYVLAEVGLFLKGELEGESGDVREEVEEENREDGEGGHGADGKVDGEVGCAEASLWHDRYKYGGPYRPPVLMETRMIRGKSEFAMHVTGTTHPWAVTRPGSPGLHKQRTFCQLTITGNLLGGAFIDWWIT